MLQLGRPFHSPYYPPSLVCSSSSYVIDIPNENPQSLTTHEASSSSSSMDADSLLLSSLKKQLKHASHIVKKYQPPVEDRSFKPFELVPNQGPSDLTLRRQMRDEIVLVSCSMDLEAPEFEDSSLEGDDDDLGISQRLSLDVRISKGSSEDGPQIVYVCSYARSEPIKIEDIAYMGKSSQEDYPYSGPYFPSLNANLKQAFQNVIKARGINSSLADLIMDQLSSKYQADYIHWLQSVRSFLKR